MKKSSALLLSVVLSVWAVSAFAADEADAGTSTSQEWVLIKGSVSVSSTPPFNGNQALDLRGSVLRTSSGVNIREAESVASYLFMAFMSERQELPACKGDFLIKLKASEGNFISVSAGREMSAVPQVLEIYCEEARGRDIWSKTNGSVLLNEPFMDEVFTLIEKSEYVLCKNALGRRYWNSMSQNPITGGHSVSYSCYARSQLKPDMYRRVTVGFSFDFNRKPTDLELGRDELSKEEYLKQLARSK